jgi:hypothetical protein
MKMSGAHILIVLMAVATNSPGAQPFLDQANGDFSSSAYVQSNISMAQTFTPSVSGYLSELDLFLSNHNTAENKPLIISIYDTLNGVPGSSFGTLSLNGVGSNWDWHYIDFSSLHISLVANQLYAFVLSCPGTFYGISPGGSVLGTSYPRGMSLVQNDIGTAWETYSRAPDLTFQTWMVVPEPSACALGMLGLATSICLWRRKTKG